MKIPFFLLASILALLLTTPLAAADTRLLTGQIMVLERTTLPDDTGLIIDVTDANDTPVTGLRSPANGAQSPFPFAIEVPRDQALILRAGLRGPEESLWLSEPVAVPAFSDDLDLGVIRAARVPLMGNAALLNCTNQLFEIGFLPEEVRLRFNEQLIAMSQQVAASGVLYVAPNNPATSIHLKGDGAIVRIDGAELAECTLIRPQTDIVEGVWSITSIDGKPTLFPSRTELVFYPDGRVSASVGCNRLIGGYRRHGGVLSFGRIAATMMACPEALMEQERQFNNALTRIDGYRFNPETGRLTLLSGGEPMVTARR